MSHDDNDWDEEAGDTLIDIVLFGDFSGPIACGLLILGLTLMAYHFFG